MPASVAAPLVEDSKKDSRQPAALLPGNGGSTAVPGAMSGADNTSVCVAVRVRPQTGEERNRGCTDCVRVMPDSRAMTIGERQFTFDHALGSDVQQTEVYQRCASRLVQAAVSGYNATIFAYGQTGSGKTYTMGTGSWTHLDEEELGVVPRAFQDIFKQTNEAVRQGGAEVSFRVSFVEIHNEDIKDLLDSSLQAKSLSIREDAQGGIFVAGAQEKQVKSLDEILQLLERGSMFRATGSTQMNLHSSRSHAIFTVQIEKRLESTVDVAGFGNVDNNAPEESIPGSAPTASESGSDADPSVVEVSSSSLDSAAGKVTEYVTSKFHFVDLAGSERVKRTGAQGARLKEGIHINCGLLALGNVISALGDERKRAVTHVPYRDSKLTRMLQDSLGGNARTVMIACVSPADINFEETLNTLKYANRARNIKNKPVINRDPNSSLVATLRSEVEQLRQQLRMAGVQPIASSHSAGGVLSHDDTPIPTNSSLASAVVSSSAGLVSRTDYDAVVATNQELRSKIAVLESACDDIALERDSLRILNLASEQKLQSYQLKSAESCSGTKEEQDVISGVGSDPIKEGTNTAIGSLGVEAMISAAVQSYVKESERLKRELKMAQQQLESYRPIVSVSSASNAIDAATSPLEVDVSHEFGSSDAGIENEDGVSANPLKQRLLQGHMMSLDGSLVEKEKLLGQLEMSQRQYENMKETFERRIENMHAEIRKVQNEKESIRRRLENDTDPSLNRAASMDRLKDLEVQLRDLKRKLKDHERLVHFRLTGEAKIRSLREEVQRLKVARAEMQMRLKDEAKMFRDKAASMDKHLVTLRREDAKSKLRIRQLETALSSANTVISRRGLATSAITQPATVPDAGTGQSLIPGPSQIKRPSTAPVGLIQTSSAAKDSAQPSMGANGSNTGGGSNGAAWQWMSDLVGRCIDGRLAKATHKESKEMESQLQAEALRVKRLLQEHGDSQFASSTIDASDQKDSTGAADQKDATVTESNAQSMDSGFHMSTGERDVTELKDHLEYIEAELEYRRGEASKAAKVLEGQDPSEEFNLRLARLANVDMRKMLKASFDSAVSLGLQVKQEIRKRAKAEVLMAEASKRADTEADARVQSEREADARCTILQSEYETKLLWLMERLQDSKKEGHQGAVEMSDAVDGENASTVGGDAMDSSLADRVQQLERLLTLQREQVCILNEENAQQAETVSKLESALQQQQQGQGLDLAGTVSPSSLLVGSTNSCPTTPTSLNQVPLSSRTTPTSSALQQQQHAIVGALTPVKESESSIDSGQEISSGVRDGDVITGGIGSAAGGKANGESPDCEQPPCHSSESRLTHPQLSIKASGEPGVTILGSPSNNASKLDMGYQTPPGNSGLALNSLLSASDRDLQLESNQTDSKDLLNGSSPEQQSSAEIPTQFTSAVVSQEQNSAMKPAASTAASVHANTAGKLHESDTLSGSDSNSPSPDRDTSGRGSGMPQLINSIRGLWTLLGVQPSSELEAMMSTTADSIAPAGNDDTSGDISSTTANQAEQTADMESAPESGGSLQQTSATMHVLGLIHTKLLDLRKQREARVTELKASLSGMWERLGVDAHYRARFFEAHQGLSQQVLDAFDGEVKRQRHAVKAAINATRTRIEAAWLELNVRQAERDALIASLETLGPGDEAAALELMTVEAQRLKSRVETTRTIVSLAKKREEMILRLRLVDTSNPSPSSAAGETGGRRGAGLVQLQEERLKRTLQRELPRVSQELKALVTSWEGVEGARFLFGGRPLLDDLYPPQDTSQAGSSSGSAFQSPSRGQGQAHDQASADTHASPLADGQGRQIASGRRGSLAALASHSLGGKRGSVGRHLPSMQSSMLQ